MANDGLAVLRSMWQLPNVSHFLAVFKNILAVRAFNTAQLENALLSKTTPTDAGAESGELEGLSLEEQQQVHLERLRAMSATSLPAEQAIIGLIEHIHIQLLAAITLGQISIDNWQEKLKSQLDHELPSDFAKVGNPLGDDKTYDECSPRDRLIILHYLCERLLHENEVVRDFAAANSEQMVHYPLGADAAFRNYWYFDDLRLYREATPVWKNRAARTVKPAKWELVCSTKEEWEQFMGDLVQSSSKRDRDLHKVIEDQLLERVMNKFQSLERAQKRASTSTTPLGPRKRSTRLIAKEVQRAEEELKQKERAEQERLQRIEEAKERKRLLEEKKLLEREQRRLQRLQEVAERNQLKAQQRAEKALATDGADSSSVADDSAMSDSGSEPESPTNEHDTAATTTSNSSNGLNGEQQHQAEQSLASLLSLATDSPGGRGEQQPQQQTQQKHQPKAPAKIRGVAATTNGHGNDDSPRHRNSPAKATKQHSRHHQPHPQPQPQQAPNYYQPPPHQQHQQPLLPPTGDAAVLEEVLDAGEYYGHGAWQQQQQQQHAAYAQTMPYAYAYHQAAPAPAPHAYQQPLPPSSSSSPSPSTSLQHHYHQSMPLPFDTPQYPGIVPSYPPSSQPYPSPHYPPPLLHQYASPVAPPLHHHHQQHPQHQQHPHHQAIAASDASAASAGNSSLAAQQLGAPPAPPPSYRYHPYHQPSTLPQPSSQPVGPPPYSWQKQQPQPPQYQQQYASSPQPQQQQQQHHYHQSHESEFSMPHNAAPSPSLHAAASQPSKSSASSTSITPPPQQSFVPRVRTNRALSAEEQAALARHFMPIE